ncbi:MAG: hypothetical protein NXH78_11820 [Hyphomonadaceae bacterium]|nr:hypothetical protein [Hyphomonadaceae bacterium]
MQEIGKTKGWFAVGIGLIVAGGAIYGLLILLGIGFAINQASAEAGAPIWAVLLIPGLVALGFLVLLAKVIVDRLNNAEDDHYSKTVDK